MSDPIIARQASSLPLLERAAFAERLAGNLRTHVFYATRAGFDTVARPEDTSAIPVLREMDAQKLAAGLQPGTPLIANLDGFPWRAQLPALAAAHRLADRRPQDGGRDLHLARRPGRPAALGGFLRPVRGPLRQAERRQPPAAALPDLTAGRPESPCRRLNGTTGRQDMKLKSLLASASSLLAVGLLGGPQVNAQAPAQKPNILVIMGDDIGLLEHQRLQSRHDGLPHAQHRPHRPRRRALHRLLRPAVVHGRPGRLHHRPVADPHRPAEGRPARRAGGSVGEGSDHRRPAQAAGLCDRPVRQEPPRRPQRVPADGARLRRVLRQPLSPQCRGGAGEHRLSEGPDLQGAVRAARRAELRCARTDDAGRGSALRQVGQAEVRGHRSRSPSSAWRPSTRSSSPPRSTSSTGANRDKKPFFVWSNSSRMHIWTHLKKAVGGQDRPRRLCRRHGRARRPRSASS